MTLYTLSPLATPFYNEAALNAAPGFPMARLADGTVVIANDVYALRAASVPLDSVSSPTYVGTSAFRYLNQPANTVNVDDTSPQIFIGRDTLWGVGGPHNTYRGPVTYGNDIDGFPTLLPVGSGDFLGTPLAFMPLIVGYVRSVLAPVYGTPPFQAVSVVVEGQPSPVENSLAYVSCRGPFAGSPGLIFFRGQGLAQGDGVVIPGTGDPICQMGLTAYVEPYDNVLARQMSVRYGAIQMTRTTNAIVIGQKLKLLQDGDVAELDGGDSTYHAVALTATPPSSADTIIVSLFETGQAVPS